MTIDRIGSIDPIQPGKKPGRTGEVQPNAKPDSIALSSEAMEKGELYQAIELVSAAPDVRAERIAELRSKIDDPSYINDTIIKATADKIMDAFGL
ncbi:flagellar biosynthesis anti-sigma factor FlgM [Breznakiella homolactica]|uniref:Flagellar biosynthesis anti-sigma factor FlgM n=1 Tax=Breznakiella homolactica TaxID=2798577 RepID=A0A7T7XPS6_9SPIR|nr:flagellar biosynthesis anti-sigma factor FlgM [Breznakiella homolactica]QQO10227.1 flagellar biosynthesis anti-sigma factor FlgM [Breznakiella homolactica]